MKRRKGIFLMDALLGLLLLSSLAMAMYPLLGRVAYLSDWATKRGRMIGEGLYAMDFMTEQLRNNLAVGKTDVYQADTYTYYAYDERNQKSAYTLYIDKEKLYLQLYTGRVEPITGESSGKYESFAFQHQDDRPLFTRQGKGCIHMTFQMSHQMSGEKWNGETSILPYVDYYRKGQIYE